MSAVTVNMVFSNNNSSFAYDVTLGTMRTNTYLSRFSNNINFDKMLNLYKPSENPYFVNFVGFLAILSLYNAGIYVTTAYMLSLSDR